MNMTEADVFVTVFKGSIILLSEKPLCRNKFFHVSRVLKYQGAGFVKFLLNPAHEPSLQPSIYLKSPHDVTG